MQLCNKSIATPEFCKTTVDCEFKHFCQKTHIPQKCSGHYLLFNIWQTYPILYKCFLGIVLGNFEMYGRVRILRYFFFSSKKYLIQYTLNSSFKYLSNLIFYLFFSPYYFMVFAIK